MIKILKQIYTNLIGIIKYRKVQVFTYYIPEPPLRKKGYREKNFDALIDKLISMGFKIKSIQSSAHIGGQNSGTWVFVTLVSSTKESFELKASEFPEELGDNALKLSDHESKFESDEIFYID